MGKIELLRAANDAEQAWMSEVKTVFGERDASMARYQDRATGERGSELRRLYDRYIAARDAYQSA